MRMVKSFFIAAAVLLVSQMSAVAEEKFGIKVYTNAKYDASLSQSVSESMSITAVCYRTGDSVIKVTEYYKKQPGMTYMGGNAEGAMFQKGEIDVTIQNPWMDIKTGAMMKDTLITIVRKTG